MAISIFECNLHVQKSRNLPFLTFLEMTYFYVSFYIQSTTVTQVCGVHYLGMAAVKFRFMDHRGEVGSVLRLENYLSEAA